MVMPHLCNTYNKKDNVLDATKRVKSATFISSSLNVPCCFQPISGKEKIDLGLSFDMQVYKVYFYPDMEGKLSANDIITYNGKSFVIRDWLESIMGFDTDYIKAVVERMPTVPEGVV